MGVSMDWSNERYVRLYVRDTTTWKRLGWDGQCVLMHLLRKVDRAGTLDLSGLEPWEAVALHSGAADDVAKRAVETLLRTQTAEVRGDSLVLPSFIEAQECTKSDKQRQREYREKKALEGSDHKDLSEKVTTPLSDQSPALQPEASALAPVTTSLGLVTLCSAVPSRAVPSSAEGSPPGEPAAPAELPPVVRIAALEKRYATAVVAEARKACAMTRRSGKLADTVWVAVLERISAHPVDAVERAMRTFCDRYADGSKDERYLEGIVRGEARVPPPGGAGRPGRLAPAKANTAEDFEGDEDIAVTMARWNQNG